MTGEPWLAAYPEGVPATIDPGRYASLNDLTQNVEGMRDQGFIRREEIDVGRDFTVRSNFFSIIVSARRENFVRQQRVVVERSVNGCQTWSTEVRGIGIQDLPEVAAEEGPTLSQ